MIASLSCIVSAFLAQPLCVAATSDIDYHTVDYEAVSAQIAEDALEYHIPGMAVIVVDQDEVLFALDIMRHMVFPAVLLALPSILGSPLWLVRYFVNDLFLFLVVVLACVISFGTGIYKAVAVRKQLQV